MSGIVAVNLNAKDTASNILLYGMYALQHRGQINAGMATICDGQTACIKGEGQIRDVFKVKAPSQLGGEKGVGHVKYGQYKRYDLQQPIFPIAEMIGGKPCLLAVDGNIIKPRIYAHDILMLFNRHLTDMLAELATFQGAFAMVYVDETKMIGIRDPWGLKPLCIGKLKQGYMLASETCAIDSVGGEIMRMVLPGECVVIENDTVQSYQYAKKPVKNCLFEMIYVARPDSYLENQSVYKARNQMGEQLFYECETKADLVIGAPDSGLIAAIGYAKASKIPYIDGIIKNRYIGRTFINDNDTERVQDIFIKLNPIVEVLKGKDIVLVDDSIVRGSTMKRTIQMLRQAGVNKIHVRICSPIVLHTCNLSLDLPDQDALIARKVKHSTVEEICEYIDADSLVYLSLEGLKKACGNLSFCDHCFSGQYPIQ